MLVVRSVLLAIALIFTAPLQSQQIQKPVPPVAGKAKDADKRDNNPDRKQTISIELPSTTNVNVSGKLEVSSNETKKQTDAESTKWTDPVSLATWLLALITAGLVWVGFSQQLTTRRQLRAYVFPETHFFASGKMENANKPCYVLRYKNSGQTPAYRVRNWADIDVRSPRDEHLLVVPPLVEKFATPISPGGSVTHHGWYIRSLTDQEIEAVRTRSRVIYVYGRIEYLDAFKEPRYTNFRLEYSGIFPPLEGATFQFCDQGNDAN